MANCRKSTICWTKYYISDIFEQKSCIQSKNQSHGWLIQSETCLQNWQNYFFKMYLLPEFLRYNNNLWLQLTGKNVSRSSECVLVKFLNLASVSPKKRYFNLIWGDSITMFLLPGFKSCTFELTWMWSWWVRADQLRKFCLSFHSQFFINRVLIFQKSRNFN